MKQSLLRSTLLLSLFVATPFWLSAQQFDGRYQLQANPQMATLNLEQNSNGNYSGIFTGTTGSAQLSAEKQGNTLVGEMQMNQMKAYFEAIYQNAMLQMTVMDYDRYGQPMPATAQILIFQRATSRNPSLSANTGEIVVNGVALNAQEIAQMYQSYHLKMAPGRYWYDRVSGLWGYEGEPTQGFGLASLPYGGELSANASNGNTGIFLNGRHLPQQDKLYLQAVVGYINPGRYWLDGQGNIGYEGGPALINLQQIAQQQKSGNSGYNRSGTTGGNQNSMHRNWYTGTGSGSDGNTSYVVGDGWSVIVD